MKKPKQINLTEEAIRILSIEAIRQGTNFKNFVESYLEIFAQGMKEQYILYDRAVRQKKKK